MLLKKNILKSEKFLNIRNEGVRLRSIEKSNLKIVMLPSKSLSYVKYTHGVWFSQIILTNTLLFFWDIVKKS